MGTKRYFRKARNSQRRAHQARLDAGWVFDTEVTLPDGRLLSVGDEFTVVLREASDTGRRKLGRFVCQKVTTNPKGDQWIDAFGGTGKVGSDNEIKQSHSFLLDRVHTVHRTATLRTGRNELK